MEFEDAKSQLAAVLRTLDPAGSLGFEGLLRNIMVEITGLGFGLAKSGPQGGSDVRTTGCNLFEVALEAKRYGEGTVLKVDALQAKLFETSRSQFSTDLWILAATRAISATDQETLTLAGEELGITVLVLDWPPELGQLPDLAVLCAEAETAISPHLGGHTNIREVLAAIRAHTGYPEAADRLRRRLTAPDIGYAAATEAMKQWMYGGLASHLNAASRLGGQFNNLLDPNRGRIPRPRYEALLDQWWVAGEPAVLIGDEGLGKTWLFLSWWHARANAEGGGLPLTLFVPAKEIGQEPLLEFMARLLEKRLKHGSVRFWQRRIAQWLTLRPDGPQILLMIDGLNQHWQKRDWADLLQSAFDEELNGRIAVLMSSWPDHWNDLQKLAPLTPRPCEITVERFDDDELDALLAVHGLHREGFGTAVLDLMKVPRISALAIEQHKALIASGDITPERLALEDWKHRIELRGEQLALSDAEFKAFVADLGTQLRSSINGAVLTRQSVFDRLGRDSGKERADLLSTVAELIAGQWLVLTDKAHQFRVNPELAPFALGLALAHQLRPSSDDATANAIIADFIDPFRGQSLGVRILRAAATVGLLDPGVSRPTRRALLVRWITEQNFSQLDFDAFWRIIGLDPELFLQIIEEAWLSRNNGSIATDEIMIKGLANAHQFDAVAPLIEARITRWLGWFWKDPLQGLVLGQIDLASPESRTRQETSAANFAAWEQFEGRRDFPAIELCTCGSPSWLSHRVFGVISFLPRAHFLKAIAAWGISRAVMGMPQHFDELAWVLRFNRDDPVEARDAVRALVEELIKSGHRLGVDAAHWLLEALADFQAEERLRRLRSAPGSTRSRSRQLPRPPQKDILNPAIAIDPSEIADAASAISSQIDLDFSTNRPLLVLARAEPNRLRELIGEMALSAPTLAPEALRHLLGRLDGFLTILNSQERGALEAAIDAILSGRANEPSAELKEWRARRLHVQLAGHNGSAQLELLINVVGDPSLLGSVQTRLLDFDQDDIKSALERFRIDDDRNTLLGWLTLLSESADRQSIDGWSELPALLRHPDAEVAELAIALAAQSSDPAALTVIAESGWTAGDATDRQQRWNRSVALLKASQILGRPELLTRADQEISAVWLQGEPDSPDALQAYASFIRRSIDRLALPRSTIVQPLIKHKKAIAILLDRADEEFWSWLDRALRDEIGVHNLDLMDEFPLVALAEALMSRRPELGLTLWSKLKEAMQDGIVKISGLNYLPFLGLSEPADTARNGVLASAVNDQELADLALQASKCDQLTWLVDKALELAHRGEVDALALSVMLLGFADESPAVAKAWLEIDGLVPRGGWLEDVYLLSRQAYERNQWARHWYSRYLLATTDGDAIAAHVLLVAAIDPRAVQWIDRQSVAALATAKRKFWDLNTDMLNAANKKQRDKLKNTLFWTGTMKQTQWPWF